VFYKQLLERLQGLPGVEFAGIARICRFSGADASLNFTVEISRYSECNQPRAKYRAASADTSRPWASPGEGPLLRSNGWREDSGIVLINNTMARRFGRTRSHWKANEGGFDNSQWCTIAGIVGV